MERKHKEKVHDINVSKSHLKNTMHCNKSKIKPLEKNHAKSQEKLEEKERQCDILDVDVKRYLKTLLGTDRKLKQENELLTQNAIESENKNNYVEMKMKNEKGKCD